jgi:hypothetical protein
MNGTDYLRTTGMDGSLILKRILKKRHEIVQNGK